MRLAQALALAAACTSGPADTHATCPDPDHPTLTWANFGSDFFCHYCTNCHMSGLPLSKRNRAPLFHDFDTLYGVMIAQPHVDGSGAGNGQQIPTYA